MQMGLKNYIQTFVNNLNDKYPKAPKTVIEIGSANGYILSKLRDCGWNVLGIEPSRILAQKANDANIRTYNGYFSVESIEEIKQLRGGVVFVEVPYLKRIIDEKQFYAFFHEHLSYFSVTSLHNIFSKKRFIYT